MWSQQVLQLGWIATLFIASSESATPITTNATNASVPIINVDDSVNGALNATAWALIVKLESPSVQTKLTMT